MINTVTNEKYLMYLSIKVRDKIITAYYNLYGILADFVYLLRFATVFEFDLLTRKNSASKRPHQSILIIQAVFEHFTADKTTIPSSEVATETLLDLFALLQFVLLEVVAAASFS